LRTHDRIKAISRDIRKSQGFQGKGMSRRWELSVVSSKLCFALIALLTWLCIGIGLNFLVFGNSGLIRSNIFYGASVGGAIGLSLVLLEWMAADAARSNRIMIWMTVGSVIGAIVGLLSVMVWGGYPQRTQADLALVILAPISLLLGALLGSVIGARIWRSRS
jgi:hypothetical protein